MEKTFAVTFVVPITVKITNDQANKDEIIAAIIQSAQKKIAGGYQPLSMDEVSEAISEDKTRGNEIPRVQDGRSEVHNDLGTGGRKDSDISEDLQSPESGKEKCNDARKTGKVGDGSKNYNQEKRGIYIDKTV